MLFSKSIPEETLSSPNTNAFVSIFDRLQVVKQNIITNSLRAFNPILCTDKRWLLNYLEDFGIKDISTFLPIVCIQQLALNIHKIYLLRGSNIGLQLLLDTLVLGNSSVEMVTTDIYRCVKLDSFTDGFITSSSLESDILYLLDKNDPSASYTFNVSLESKIFNDIEEGTQEYTDIIRCIKTLIRSFVGFYGDCSIEITTTGKDTYSYPAYLNDYFKN